MRELTHLLFCTRLRYDDGIGMPTLDICDDETRRPTP